MLVKGATGRCGLNLKSVIFKLTSRTDIWNISCEIELRGMPQDLTGDQSRLVQEIAGAIRQQAIT